MLKARVGMMAAGALAAAGLLLAIGSAAVGQANETDFKKIAEMVQKGDMAAAKKLAAAYAKKKSDRDEAVEELMILFKDVKKKGLGVQGSDLSIDKLLGKISQNAPTPAALGKMSDGFIEMGYNVATIGLILEQIPPTADSGRKTKKLWIESSTKLVEGGIALSEATKNKNTADIRTHASKAYTGCVNCHAEYK